MANTALRQIFIDAAIEMARRGDKQVAHDLLLVVKQTDRQQIERRGRKRGEIVANRPDYRCFSCQDTGMVQDGGIERDCPECSR